jgi:hypothetical protein
MKSASGLVVSQQPFSSLAKHMDNAHESQNHSEMPLRTPMVQPPLQPVAETVRFSKIFVVFCPAAHTYQQDDP